MAKRKVEGWLPASLVVLMTTACTAGVQAEATLSSEADEPKAEPAHGDRHEAESHETETEAEPAAAPVADPGPPGTITVIYQRQRITTCAMTSEDGEKVCAATAYVDHRGKGAVVLLPVDEQGEEDTTRAQVALAFEEEPSTQTREVELAPGRWDLEWKGESTARDEFQVTPSDRFEITLQAIAGMCSQQGKKCSLEPQKNQQVIELPVARGLN